MTLQFSPFIDEEHQNGRFFFRAVKEGDVVTFASDGDIDRQHWVYKLYNATGQSYKPAAPKLDVATASSGGSDTLPRAKGKVWPEGGVLPLWPDMELQLV